MRSKTFLIPAVLLAIALVAVGCGGDDKKDSGSKDSASKTVSDAYSKLAKTSHKFTTSLVLTVEDKDSFTNKTSGSFDPKSKEGTLTTSVAGLTFDLIGTSDSLYIGSANKKYVKIPNPGGGFSALSSLGIPTPSSWAPLGEKFLMSEATVTESGSNTINGQDTTKYTAKYDLSNVGNPDLKEIFGTLQRLTVYYWINDDGELVQSQIIYEVPASSAIAQAGGGIGSANQIFGYSDYGVEVNPTPPPDSEVISASDIEDAIAKLAQQAIGL